MLGTLGLVNGRLANPHLLQVLCTCVQFGLILTQREGSPVCCHDLPRQNPHAYDLTSQLLIDRHSNPHPQP